MLNRHYHSSGCLSGIAGSGKINNNWKMTHTGDNLQCETAEIIMASKIALQEVTHGAAMNVSNKCTGTEGWVQV
jgi:hypothetical protein